MRRTPLPLAVLAVLASGVVAAGCSGGGTPAAQGQAAHHGPRTASTSIATTTSTTQPPVTPIAWTACNGNLQCGTLVVPLDYATPSGPTIPIAVARHPAEDPAHRIGSLVIDPGGPGVSGIDDMANELSALTPQLLDDFDIVMFDPRGVERSDPVSCGTDTGSAASDPAPSTPSEQAATIQGLRQFADACEKNSANLLPHVGSTDAARDMDRLRQALGDTGLTYMGQSYGTLLGLTYAALFPTHIRAMVLDSVIDPALSFDQITTGQADGFEAILNAFFTWCAGSSACRWRPSGDPTTALLALLQAAQASPVPAGGGDLAGAGQLYDAVLGSLYSQSDWPQLGALLAADAAGNGAPVVAQSNHYNTGGSSNADVAATAIDCLDHPVSHDLASYGALADTLKASAPVFGPLLTWGEAGCAVWPAPPTRTVGPVAAPGAPPILVVGTTNDPATPYAWAVNVSKELDRGVLLTHDGDDHVAYFSSACVRADVQTYLASGQTPPSGTTCTS
ncbi:MAG TPA: alpha/beta hydrolase [Acidimicrobiales bacterium]|jgi:pimeloyl-ACP methyl ester carboxylesterase|nr:alpha/beta hydrolase [Acidimicrobiales bacterium]